MARKNYFFAHAADSYLNENMLALVDVYGWAGYGLYWRLCEALFMADNNVLDLSDKTYRSFKKKPFSTTDKVYSFIMACINDFDLFKANDQYFYSEMISENSDKVEELIDKRRKAANIRWSKDKEFEGDAPCISFENHIRRDEKTG